MGGTAIALVGVVLAVVIIFVGHEPGPASVNPVLVEANIQGPWSLALDEQHNALFVSDSLNHRVIRRDLGSQTVTVVAGGDPAGPPSRATSLQLQYPTGIALVSDGSFYLADSVAYRVYRIHPDGTATVVAGTGQAGFSGDGGPGTTAELRGPHGLVVEPNGDLLIADTDNNRVRRLDTDGRITTIYGNGLEDSALGDGGSAAHATIRRPEGLSRGADGSLFVTQWRSCLIRRIDDSGVISTFAGIEQPGFGGDGGPATSAPLNGPSGIAVGRTGDVVFSDFNNNRVRRIGVDGEIETVVGSGRRGLSVDGVAARDALLANPSGVAVAADGSVYIADLANNRIVLVNSTGHLATVLR
ncbi:MAG: hypothetical protein ACRDRI_12580 [Pseudonocardiaceae bacterium]